MLMNLKQIDLSFSGSNQKVKKLALRRAGKKQAFGAMNEGIFRARLMSPTRSTIKLFGSILPKLTESVLPYAFHT